MGPMTVLAPRRNPLAEAGWTAAEIAALRAALTRRRLIGGGLALGAANLLAACGGAAPTATANPNAGYPRTVSHALGDTVIATKPARIATLNDAETLDNVLALGLKPILYGQTGSYGVVVPPWIAATGYAGVDSFDAARGVPLDFERIASVGPDLVLGSWIAGDPYQKLSGIAPTLVIKDNDLTPWQEVQRLVGRATGREAAADAVIAETEAIIAAQAARLKALAGRAVTVAYQFFDQFLINGAAISISRLVTRLGLTIKAPDQAKISMLSLEQIRAVEDADILLSPIFIQADLEKQESNPLFRTLPAVRAGRYLPLSVEVARASYLESALSVRWVIPQLADALLAAAEGKGKRLD